MAEKKKERFYRIGFPTDLYARMQAAADVDGRTMKAFVIQACRQKTEEIEMTMITRPWVPSGLKRTR